MMIDCSLSVNDLPWLGCAGMSVFVCHFRPCVRTRSFHTFTCLRLGMANPRNHVVPMHWRSSSQSAASV